MFKQTWFNNLSACSHTFGHRCPRRRGQVRSPYCRTRSRGTRPPFKPFEGGSRIAQDTTHDLTRDLDRRTPTETGVLNPALYVWGEDDLSLVLDLNRFGHFGFSAIKRKRDSVSSNPFSVRHSLSNSTSESISLSKLKLGTVHGVTASINTKSPRIPKAILPS